MTKRTLLQKVWDVRRIIDFVKKHGRITTEQVARMTGLPIKTYQVTERTRGSICHGRLAAILYPRASIEFYLMESV